jgi:hypothetical protein
MVVETLTHEQAISAERPDLRRHQDCRSYKLACGRVSILRHQQAPGVAREQFAMTG